MVTLPIAAMQGAEASVPYRWVPIFFPGWREAQSGLTSCPRMLSHMKQLASVGIEPQPLDYESNIQPAEPHETSMYSPSIDTGDTKPLERHR